jgi:hypothetical protein
MWDAEQNISVAMTLFDAAPAESLPRSVRNLIAQAGSAVLKSPLALVSFDARRSTA